MSDIRRAVKEFRKRLEPKREILSGWLVDEERTGTAEIAAKPGYVYVLLDRGGGSATGHDVIEAWSHVRPVVGWAVRVGETRFRPGEYTVLEVDDEAMGGTIDGKPSLEHHHEMHEWNNPDGGDDSVFPMFLQLYDFGVWPYSGLSVAINSGIYTPGCDRRQLDLTEVALDAYQPGANQRYVLICLSPTGTIEIVPGAIQEFLDLDDMPPAPSADHWCLAAVRIRSTDTEIVHSPTNENIIDLRWQKLGWPFTISADLDANLLDYNHCRELDLDVQPSGTFFAAPTGSNGKPSFRFIELSDLPSGLGTTFLGLVDTPASYVGEAGNAAVVNVGETALEFVAIGGAIQHNNLLGLQGGQAGEYYHLTATQHTAVTAMVTAGLDALTTAEVDQLENIGVTTVSVAQWGYLGAMNQGVATGDSPTFANVYVPDGGFVGINAGVGWTFDDTGGDISTAANVGINEVAPQRLLHITTANYDEGILIESTHAAIPLYGGPRVELYVNSPSPAVNDYLGSIEFSGMDSLGNKTDYAMINAMITSPTNLSERGSLVFYTMGATLTPRTQITYDGTLQPYGASDNLGATGHLWNVFANYVDVPDTGWIGVSAADERIEYYTAGYIAAMGASFGVGETTPERRLHVKSAAYDDGVTIESTHADADAGPRLRLWRNSGSPAVDDLLGLIEFDGQDSTDARAPYAAIGAKLISPTNTIERGELQFFTANGALTQRMTLNYLGNLGIGIATPGVYKLYAYQNIVGTDLVVLFENAAAGRGAYGAMKSAGNYCAFQWEAIHAAVPQIWLAGQYATSSYTIRDHTLAVNRLTIDLAGNVIVGVTAAGANAAKTLVLTNTATAPAASANLVHLYAEDVSASAVLAVYQETAPVVVGTFTPSHKWLVRINGVSYHIQLDAV